ncbi:hypothetical protein Tco_1317660 [Tanacetum coccineum]
MSNSNTNLQTQSSNALHNAIMEAGSKDRPPMLAPGNYLNQAKYAQEILKKHGMTSCDSIGTPMATKHLDADLSENKEHFLSEKEAIFLLLTGIGDDIYSTVDAFNDIRAERIAKSANPLALLAAAQPYSDNYYQAPKPQRTNTTSSVQQDQVHLPNTKEKRSPNITPQIESVSEEDSDPEQAQRDKEMQKNLALLGKEQNEDTTPRYNNDNQSGQFGNQRTMTVAGARETVGSQDTDEEIDEQELEAHYSFMAKIQEVLLEESSSTEQPLEQVDQNATECVDERAALANLIANLTLDTEENKMILKQLKKSKRKIDSRIGK